MIKTLYVLDRNKNIIGFISNNGSASTPFFNDKFTQILSSGAETFEFDVVADDKTNILLIEGNYIMFEYNGRYKMFQIMTAEDDDSSYQIIKSCYCEIVGLELLNSYVRPCTVRGDIVTFFNVILQDSNWQLGKYSPSLVNISKDIDITESKSIYTLIQENISTYNNIEIEFRTEFSNNKVTGYYIDVCEDGGRGKVTHKRFEHGTNVSGITRKGDITGFYSALIGEGKNGINFKDIIWSKENGDPCDKPAGQDFLLDDAAHKMFSLDGKYITGLYKTEDTNAYDLILSTYNKLQEVKNIKYSYEVEVGMKLEEFEQVEIGDTVYVIDNNFNPPLLLEARVSKLEISFSDYRSNKCTLDNFKEVKGKIKNWGKNDIIKDTIDQLTGFKGKLTQADIDRIREFLADLDIQSEAIEKLLKKYEDSLEDTVIDKTEITEDSENYRAIKLSKIDGGLWLGDNRIYGIKKNKCATITSKSSENASSSCANEYKNAVAYYAKFSLGTKANSSSMDKLINKSNKYKVSTIVKYWSKKFGLDPYLVYAVIMAESSGNPYCKTKSSAGGYGIMQCERAAYFNKKQTIKFLDGSTKSFTPSYSTMKPGGTTTLNGVKVNKGISNQIMFGCHELRKSLVRYKYNIFASLMGYNFGIGGADWVVCKYVANKFGYTFKDAWGYTNQSSKVQAAYFKELETLKAPWSNLRKTYVSVKRMGTATNIEYYLRWYRSVNGQLPYALDSKGKKKGYGANKTSIVTTSNNTTIKTGVATTLRNKIVAKAKEICKLHQTYKKATYDQDYRIVNDDKRFKAPKTIYGIKKPYCYDCSSLVSCAYKETGLTSVYAKSCQYGTLVEGATAKSGYKMFKLTKSSIDDAIAGDIIMFCNNKCPSSFTREQAIKKSFTHHTAIYCGKVNGKHMLAHASKWAYHPEAMRYESFDAYNNRWKTKDYHLWNYCFILRPWDLVAKDKSSTETKTTTTTNAPKVETNELSLKGLNGAKPSDYYDYKSLIQDITINNITDDDKYPKTVSHAFCHFGINDLSDEGIQSYKNLINALLKKYPKKPIFIAKEFYVDSRYCTNWEEKNAEITNFNNAMLDFSNRTKYVIQVGVPAAILDSNKKYLSTTYSADGWTMKDKTACNAYYTAYKKAILVLATGGSVSSSSTSANLSLHTENIYKYTKPMKKIEFRLPSKPDDSYYSRLIFTTNKNSEPTKYKQSELVYLQGTHCKKGQLIPKADTTYTLVIYYNPDTEISNKKYLGSVSAIHKGGSYAKFDKFKHANDLVNYAKSYYDKGANFIYNSTTPADFTNPAENISKWKTNGKMHIDDSSFLNYILMGWNYAGSPYGKNARTDNKKNSKCSWALPSTRNEANIAKYFVEQGWVLDGADLDKFTNLQAGDIVFMDADSINNGLFMGCSHTAIVKGKNSSGVWEVYECNNTSNIIEVNTITTLTKKNILFIGRIRVG
ncbi:hypothetical protein TPDSL_14090 [Terrisporobacter petrolearius]|uniref:phage tail protein n=1 Tax=Terrisporobacter petrolearius TaxID=1460447 RepID=UPI003369A339